MEMYWVCQSSPAFVPVIREVWERSVMVARGTLDRLSCDLDSWVLEQWRDGHLVSCEGGDLANCPYVSMVFQRVHPTAPA